MDIPPARLARILLPKVPLLLKTIVLSKLSMSPNSDKQDTRTEAIVNIIREILRTDRSLSVVQASSIKDPGIKGKVWIAKATCAAPDDAEVRDAVIRGVREMGTTNREDWILPDIVDVEGEWTGYRAQAEKNTQRPEVSEQEQYDNLMKEVNSDVTILYLHGGAYFLMDPASHRTPVSVLCKKTGGRAFSVRYRLAPQYPFPAALLDALTAYLYLLAPPPGSLHKPVPASKIIFSGDSAGGNLSAALCLLLLTLKKAGMQSIRFHGKDVPIEVPAGMALNSPWCDITRSLPSIWSNAKYDYLDPPTATGLPHKALPPDEIWPTKPPRAEIFCQASLMMHPIVSPVIATPEMWHGVPPTFICGGSEGLEDEFTVTARHIYLAGGSVDFVKYEGYPHCFAMIFPDIPAAKDCLSRWGQFCVDAVEGRIERKDHGLISQAFKSPLEFQQVELETIGLSDAQVKERMQHVTDMATERERNEVQAWEQNQAKAKL